MDPSVVQLIRSVYSQPPPRRGYPPRHWFCPFSGKFMSNLRQRGTKEQFDTSTASDDAAKQVNGHNRGVSSSILHSHSHSYDGGDNVDDADQHTDEAMILLDALRGRGGSPFVFLLPLFIFLHDLE